MAVVPVAQFFAKRVREELREVFGKRNYKVKIEGGCVKVFIPKVASNVVEWLREYAVKFNMVERSSGYTEKYLRIEFCFEPVVERPS